MWNGCDFSVRETLPRISEKVVLMKEVHLLGKVSVYTMDCVRLSRICTFCSDIHSVRVSKVIKSKSVYRIMNWYKGVIYDEV